MYSFKGLNIISVSFNKLLDRKGNLFVNICKLGGSGC